MDCITSESIGFNQAPPLVMHIDLNSCFASVEQQANPLLRGKPVAVGAYTTPGGCILAASREAKALGVKTGMRVGEGKILCPNLIVLPSDPNKYRFVNRKLLTLFKEYTGDVEVKSIDEMVLNFSRSGVLATRLGKMPAISAMMEIGREIKQRIRSEIGDWLTVSIGIAPNRFLAKTGSNIHKPDGLDVITAQNIEAVLSPMQVEDLCGIKAGYGTRLRNYGIATAMAFYNAPIKTLKVAFHSIVGYHWWLRLHGWEADDRQFPRRSYGHSYALYTPYTTRDTRLHQILCQLTEKMGRRLRSRHYRAGGVHVACFFSDRTFWHKGEKLGLPLFAGADLYKAAMRVLTGAPDRGVRILAVSCSYLTGDLYRQLTMDEKTEKAEKVTKAMDAIINRWGDAAIFPARILSTAQKIKDRISFGGVKELEEFVFRDAYERTKEEYSLTEQNMIEYA